MLFVSSTRTSSSSAFPEPRGERSRHFCKSAFLPVRISPSLLNDGGVWLVLVPEKFWQVPFPCLACNVKPRKQRATVAEECQGRFQSLPLLRKHMELVLSQRLFEWFCSLFEPFLNKVVILLYPTGDDWANSSHGSRVYSDFGVQGTRGTLHRYQMDFLFPQKTQQELERLSQLKAFCSAWLCSWWSMQSALLDVMLCSKLLSKRATCGPAVTHRLKAPRLLASPTAPPFPFTIALHYYASTWAVQCDGKRKWRCSRTCQSEKGIVCQSAWLSIGSVWEGHCLSICMTIGSAWGGYCLSIPARSVTHQRVTDIQREREREIER